MYYNSNNSYIYIYYTASYVAIKQNDTNENKLSRTRKG